MEMFIWHGMGRKLCQIQRETVKVFQTEMHIKSCNHVDCARRRRCPLILILPCLSPYTVSKNHWQMTVICLRTCQLETWRCPAFVLSTRHLANPLITTERENNPNAWMRISLHNWSIPRCTVHMKCRIINARAVCKYFTMGHLKLAYPPPHSPHQSLSTLFSII